MSELRVIEPGMHSTLEDLGRPGRGSSGVPSGGASDHLSLRIGNRLLGNQDVAAGIEITLRGGRFAFGGAALACLTGAHLPEARLEHAGRSRELRMWEPVVLDAESEISLGPTRGGIRSYLCVGGGIRTRVDLGSRSTLIVGGEAILGSPLGADTRVPLDRLTSGLRVSRLPRRQRERAHAILARRTLRVVDSVHTDIFDEESRQHLMEEPWKLSAQSNRAGSRLEGVPLQPPGDGRVRSEALVPGCIQVPPDGRPIIVGVDGPVTGGYPVIACVIGADLPALGQRGPTDEIRFQRVTREQASELLREQDAFVASVPVARSHGHFSEGG